MLINEAASGRAVLYWMDAFEAALLQVPVDLLACEPARR